MSSSWCPLLRYEPIPLLTTLDPKKVYVADFGRYGGVNDRFALVPRAHGRAFFADRFDRWLRNDFSYKCLPQ